MSIFNSLSAGYTEIISHPGYIDKELLAAFPVIYNWEKEIRALTSPKIKALIKDCGIELV